MVAAARSSLTSDVNQSVALATAGTERLSSRLIGIVSTAAAIIAATQGIHSVNQRYGGGMTASRHHQHRNDAAAPPHAMNAADPTIDFSRFHGMRAPELRRPTSVAMPSPNASTPHAAATMSRRSGKRTVSSRTAIGYSTIPERSR